jgi:spore germination protein YaaH
MSKFFIFVIFCTLVIASGILYVFSNNKRIEKIDFIGKQKNISTVKESNTKLFISGWLPYWRKTEGFTSLSENLTLFDEIHPFAFGVNLDGSLQDTLKIKNSPWPELQEKADKENIAIVPTILWGDAKAMHKVFSNQILLDQHVSSISKLLEESTFSGVDIDYEGKDVVDRDIFSEFLQKLHEKLAVLHKTINCTVEARTQDSPPEGWSGVRAMAYANDYTALNTYCDTITIMVYDEMFQVYGEKSVFRGVGDVPFVPNADNQWVEQVVKYALQYISPQRFILGVPTYGWEFETKKIAQGYQYTRIQSVSFQQASKKIKDLGIIPMRNVGGELSLVYKDAGRENIVTFADGEMVRKKMDIARKYKLKGISLFKLDGLSDPDIFSILKDNRNN